MGRVVNYVEYDGSGATVTFSRQDSYNNRSQMTDEATYTRVGQDQYKTTTHNDYLAETSAGSGSFTGTYMAGAVTRGYTTTTKNDGGAVTAGTWNKFAWRDDAEIVAIDYKADVNQATVFRTDYSYDPLGTLASVRIADGRPRTLSFVTAPDGAILQRDEADALSGGDPREVYYAFDGVRVGDVSNNGTSDTDYAQSIAAHASTPGTGPFRGGAAGGSAFADFDQSYDPINGLTYQATASRYTVRDGDTLAAIAQTVWGDASLWYMLADANGLDGSETLPAGRDLIVPDKIANLHNTSATYRVYDPNDTIGNTTPSDPAPGRHHGHHCGAFGQILLVAVAVAVSIATYGALTGPATAGLAAIEAGAAAGAAGSIASQGVGLATGIQDKFSFKGVALAALAGGVGAGVGTAAGLRGATGIAGFGQGVARGAIGAALTQGIALATGLQHRFDWAGVAVSGLSGGVFGAIDPALARAGVGRFADTALSDTAAAIAGAGAQSLLTGSDFGDTLLRSLPQVIGETIGNAVGDDITARGAADADAGGRAGGGGASGGWSGSPDTGGFSLSVASGYQPNAPAPATLDNGTIASAEANTLATSNAAAAIGAGEIVVTASRQSHADVRALDDTEFQTFQNLAASNGWDAARENAEIHQYVAGREDLQVMNAAASLILDLTPGIGAAKAGLQLYTGTDAITGDPANRWLQAGGVVLGIVPGSGLIETAGAKIAESGVLSGVALARKLGLEGEEAIGITGAKAGIRIPGSNQLRFPDAVDVKAGTLTEVKNVGYQSYTRQLRDYAAYANDEGFTFNLYVRGAADPLGQTRLSEPLQAAIRQGKISLNAIPGR